MRKRLNCSAITSKDKTFNVSNGEWEKIPRLQAKTLVGLRKRDR